MIFQFGDIKIVFDGLFRHLWRERDCEKTGKNEKLLDGKTFQINLKSNDKESESIFFPIFMNTQCIVGSPEGKHFKNVSKTSHSTTQTVVF